MPWILLLLTWFSSPLGLTLGAQEKAKLDSFVSSKEALQVMREMRGAFQRNDFEGAVARGQAFLRQQEDPRVRFTLGNAFFYAERFKLAFDEYRKLLPRYESDDSVLSNLGKCAFLSEQYEQANTFLARAVRVREGESLEALLAESLIQTGQDAAALPLLLKELARRPQELRLYRSITEIHRRRGDTGEAGRMALAWLESNGMDPILLRILAQVRTVEGDYPRARSLYLVLELSGAAEASDVRRMADLYLIEGAYGEAIRYLLKLEEYDSQTFEDRKRLAIAYARIDRAQDAVEVLTALIEEQSDASLWAQLGYAHQVLRDEEKALEAFAKAMERDSHRVDPVLAAAGIHRGRGEFEQAQTLYWNATALEGGAARAYAGLGEIAWKRGERREAVAYYQKAQSLDPTDAQIYDRWVVLRNRLERSR